MSNPLLIPGGLRLVSAEGRDALRLCLDLRAVAPRERGELGGRFLRDCVAAATTLPVRQLGTVAQAAIHALRLPGEGETVEVALIPPHNRLNAATRFMTADALCVAFFEREYRLVAAGLAQWAAIPGLDAAAINNGRIFLSRWGGPLDIRLLHGDPKLAPLLG